MPLMAIGQGLQPILGFNYSCGRFDRVYDVTRYALVVSSLFSVGGFLVLMLLTQPIIGLFTTDEALIVEGVRAGRFVFLAFFLVGFQFVGSTIFQALGKVVKTLVSSTSRQILFYIPLVLVLPRFLETDGVWLAQPAADVLSFLVVLFMVVPQLRDFRRRSETQQSELRS